MAGTRAKTVFAVGCHPDDIEFTIAGTLFLLKERGWDVHYMTISNGSWGSSVLSREALIRTRREESIKAAEIIGAHYHEALVDDLEVYYERQTLMRLTAVFREVNPDVLLCTWAYQYTQPVPKGGAAK